MKCLALAAKQVVHLELEYAVVEVVVAAQRSVASTKTIFVHVREVAGVTGFKA